MKKSLFIPLTFIFLSVPVFAQVLRPMTDSAAAVHNRVGADRVREHALREVKEFYRKPTKKELSLVAVDKTDERKYADFLKQNNTGISRLMPDHGCNGLLKKKSDDKMCEKLTMPGGGSAFSFRRETYQFWELADLLFDGKNFYSLGGLSQGFLVNLGNISLSEVTLQTKGIGYLADYVPAENMDGAIGQNNKFATGVKNGDFIYRKALPAEPDATYVLRSVAYKGEVMREFKRIPYNELDFDERKDVIVAFQFIRKADDGSVTILWKKLRENDSPKLKE